MSQDPELPLIGVKRPVGNPMPSGKSRPGKFLASAEAAIVGNFV
jgi:hypothetical protein